MRSDTFLRDWRPRWIACTFAAASKSDNAGREFSRFGFTSDGVAGVASATSPPDEFMRGGACAGICGPPTCTCYLPCAIGPRQVSWTSDFELSPRGGGNTGRLRQK